MTGVASRRVGIWGGTLLGILAFVPKVGALILDMPEPVAVGMLIAISAILIYGGTGLVKDGVPDPDRPGCPPHADLGRHLPFLPGLILSRGLSSLEGLRGLPSQPPVGPLPSPLTGQTWKSAPVLNPTPTAPSVR